MIGTTAAAQSLDLIFSATGTVKEVLVKEGDQVTAGQTLARLDDAALQAQLVNAQAALVAAQAKLTQTKQRRRPPEDIAAAQAQLASAQASYAKLTAAPATPDVAAARAALASAQSGVRQAHGWSRVRGSGVGRGNSAERPGQLR